MTTALLAALAVAFPAASPEDEAILAGGAPVIHPLQASSPSAVKVLGLVDVRASGDAVWQVLLDFPGRLPTNPSLASVTEYQPRTATEQWWVFTVRKFGMEVTYHNHYLLDRPGGRLVHELDATQPNDLASNGGTYELGACSTLPAPCTRLAWTVETDFGRSLPSMIRTWLGKAAVQGFLVDLATRAPTYR